jgi:hypothetical protein
MEAAHASEMSVTSVWLHSSMSQKRVLFKYFLPNGFSGNMQILLLTWLCKNTSDGMIKLVEETKVLSDNPVHSPFVCHKLHMT